MLEAMATPFKASPQTQGGVVINIESLQEPLKEVHPLELLLGKITYISPSEALIECRNRWSSISPWTPDQ
ncbi:hypothetical protein Pint_32859 [Pistacia integerrima]|uniref:Uncharacterized protein n=1 Tax=Pistacia integerrima TaxID=434235 RepID=A0ACC0X5M0_9ROSI|nr:hypothetical protein Pint_32859 [Pistacia integerrima]